MSVNTRNVVVVNHETLKQLIIHKYWLTYKGIQNLPLYIHGPTACGKTRCVIDASKEIARKLEKRFTMEIDEAGEDTFLCYPIYLSRYNPEDFAGTTVPDFENKVTTKLPLDLLKKLQDPEIAGILFLDEFDQADQFKQNSIQQILLEHRYGDIELSPKIMVICAGNGIADGNYATFELPDNIKSRCVHAYLPPPTIQDWVKWAYKHKIHPDIIAFLMLRPDFLYFVPENAYAIATPRGWEFASNELYALNGNLEKWLIVATHCGSSAGIAFKEFLQLRQDVDPETYLKNPQAFLELPTTHEKGRDLQYALAPAFAKLFADRPDLRKDVITLSISLTVGTANKRIHEEVANKVQIALNKLKDAKIDEFLRENYPETVQFINRELAVLILKLCKITAGEEALKEALASHPHSLVTMCLLKLIVPRDQL